MQERILHKGEVEAAVRAAQDLLLADGGVDGGGLVPFSRDTVVLEIRGAPVSLSLVRSFAGLGTKSLWHI